MSQAQEVFLFQPTSVAGCQLWLDAADVNGNGTQPTNGTTLSTWKDKSSNGYTGTAVNSPTYETNTQNKLPVVRFNGTNQYINFGNVVNLGTSQIFVFAVTQFTGDGSIVAKSSLRGFAGRWFLIRFAGDGGTEFGADATGSGVIAPFADSTTTTQLLMGAWDRSIISTFQNGTQKATASLSNSSSLSNTDILLVGAYGNSSGSGPQAGFYLNGFICEIMVYLSTITTSQRQQIEGYLAWKWGIQGSLPSNHPFKTYRPLAQTPIPPQVPNMPIVTQNLAVFAPTQISGCQLWLDGADSTTFTLSGTTVTQWRDKSSNAYTTTVSSGANGPTRVGNSLQFRSASAQSLSISQGFGTSFVNTTLILFFVAQRVTPSGYQFILSGATGAINQILQTGFFNDNMQLNMYGNDFNVAIPAYSVSAEPTRIYCYALNTSAAEQIMNGSTLQSTAGTYRLTAFLGPQLGRRYSGGDIVYHNFNLSEMIGFAPIISVAQRQQVEGYLAWKWDLVANLPNGHPYKRNQIAPFPFRTVALNGSLGIWQPTQISGSVLWLDAADTATITLSNAFVTQWTDKISGRAFTTGFSNVTAPTYSNGGIFFNSASNQGLRASNTDLPLTGNFAMFIVHTLAARAGNNLLLSFTSLGNATYFLCGNNTTNTFRTLYRSTASIAGGLDYSDSVSNTYSMSVYALQNTNLSLTRSFNGTVWGTTNAVANFAANIPIVDIGFFQAYTGPGTFIYSRFQNGFINEIVLYNSSITTSQRQQMEGYLAWKWGFQGSLPANHPFKRWPPPP